MTFIKEFKKNFNGAYPVTPGMFIDLGDYGYWEEDKWNHLGNIKKDFGEIFFTEKERACNQSVEILVNTKSEILAGAEATVSTQAALDGEAEIKIDFLKANSWYFNAFVTKELYFPSIDGEIKKFIEEIDSQRPWNKDYCVAVSLIKASNYIQLLSSKEGASLTLLGKCKVLEGSCSGIGGKVYAWLNVKNNVDFIKTIISPDNNDRIIGVKFIRYTHSGLFKTVKKITYLGEAEGMPTEH